MDRLPGVSSYGSTNSEPRLDYESGAQSDDMTEPLLAPGGPREPTQNSSWTLFKKWAWIVPVVYTNFWAAGVMSLEAPFFPPLADSRGIPAWKYGFFFSMMKLMMLPGAVIAERLISGISPKAGYLGGQVATVLFCVLFGFLYWVKGAGHLLAFSLALAAVGGCANTVYSVCLYTLLTSRFGDNGGMFIGLMECLWGAGTLVGSSIGGALIDLWAFPLPFFVIGGLLLLSLPSMAIINPSRSQRARNIPSQSPPPVLQGEGKKYSHLLYDPIFIIDLVTVMISWAMTSFNEPTLEPFLRRFKMSSTEVGTVYTVQFVGYSIGALLAGIFAKFKMEPFMNFFSLFVSTVSYCIVGPIPLIPIQPNLFLVYTSQVLMGIGLSTTYVSPYMHAVRHVVETAGYPDNEKTHGIVTSATYQFMVFGAVLTSPLAGYITQKIDYQHSTMIFAGILAFWTLVTGVVWVKLDYAACSRPPPMDDIKEIVTEVDRTHL